MICNGNSEGMCIAGVFGGIGSGVTESTKAIFLESAHFNPQWVRRTSMHHNLRTDAAKVFEKGSDPGIVVDALKRAALLIKELAGGTISSDIIDLYPNPIQPVEVEVSYAYVNRLIGVNMEHADIRAILDAMHMEVLEDDDTHFKVAVPTDKSDVTRPADVVEEILRIYGLNKVPVSGQIRSSVSYSDYPNARDAQNKISDYLSANGFHEMMAVSLTESRYFTDILPLDESSLVYINNTSNIQLDVMRPSMLFSGLEAVAHNQNRQQQDVKVYEFGKTYRALEEGYEEHPHLSLFLSGQRQPESWLNKNGKAVDYYSLRAFVQQVLERMGITGFQVTALENDPVFLYGLRYHHGPKPLVEFGQVNKAILKKMDIRQPVYYADFKWEALVATLRKHRIEFEELTKYPSVRRDLALVVENSVKFSDIVAIARKAGKKLLKEINLFDVYSNTEQLGADKKSYAVSYLFQDPSKTLQDKEVDKVMDKLIRDYEQKIGATIRR
jgi:phenylalanyl-tRNA synthetase beta chain